MRIATWNINGMNARLEYIGHWLRAIEPDVVGLQELKMADEKFPHDKLEEMGYRVVTHGQKGWNGVAVLTKLDAPACEVLQRGLPGQDDLGSRLISVKTGGITFITVYCPNGKSVEHDDFKKKLGWFESLREFVGGHVTPDGPVVLTGDFNIVPAPIDSWNEAKLGGKIFHTEDERRRFADILEWGFTDIWRARKPDEPGHTWWDYRAGAFHKKMGLRIDLVLGTTPVINQVDEIHFDRNWRKKVEGLTASDHAPVWVDLVR